MSFKIKYDGQGYATLEDQTNPTPDANALVFDDFVVGRGKGDARLQPGYIAESFMEAKLKADTMADEIAQYNQSVEVARHLPDQIAADALVDRSKIRLEWVNSMQVGSPGFGGAMASAAQVVHAQQAWNQIEDDMAAAGLSEVERLEYQRRVSDYLSSTQGSAIPLNTGTLAFIQNQIGEPGEPDPRGQDANPDELCFLGDVSVAISVDTEEPHSKAQNTKRISEISVGDCVLTYVDSSGLKTGEVVGVKRSRVSHILDFWGTGVTPGHAYFCAGGKFAGHHVPIMDILRTDGAVMRADGSLMRASTGADVGSEDDQLLRVFTGDKLSDGSFAVSTSGTLRAGMRVRLQDGREFKLLDLIIANGGRVTADGLIQPSDGSDPTPLHWTFTESLPKPEDYILARSAVTLEEIYAAGEWEAIGTRMASPEGAQPTQGRPKPNIPPAFADRPDVPKHRVRERSSASKLQ
jgi:hypothetical protein